MIFIFTKNFKKSSLNFFLLLHGVVWGQRRKNKTKAIIRRPWNLLDSFCGIVTADHDDGSHRVSDIKLIALFQEAFSQTIPTWQGWVYRLALEAPQKGNADRT